MSEIDLNDLRIASPCKIPWDSMKGTDTKRYCSQCHLNVYNISNMTHGEAVKLIGNDTAHCFSLFRRPDGTVITRDCPVGVARIRKYLKWSAVIVISLLTGPMLFQQFMKREAEAEAQRQEIYKESRRVLGGGGLSAKGKVVVCVSQIRSGDFFSPEMLEEIEVSQSKIPMDAITSASILAGKISRSYIQPGEIIDQAEVLDPLPKAYRLRLERKLELQASEIADSQNISVSQLLSGWIKDKLR